MDSIRVQSDSMNRPLFRIAIELQPVAYRQIEALWVSNCRKKVHTDKSPHDTVENPHRTELTKDCLKRFYPGELIRERLSECGFLSCGQRLPRTLLWKKGTKRFKTMYANVLHHTFSP